MIQEEDNVSEDENYDIQDFLDDEAIETSNTETESDWKNPLRGDGWHVTVRLRNMNQ